MAKRRKKGTRRKKSVFRMAKGGVYAASVALPIWQAYNQTSGTPADRGTHVLKMMAFTNPSTGKFDATYGMQIWAPVIGIGILDIATSKLGLQKRLSRSISGLLG